MADTLQIIRWSLERKCIFRTGEEWFLPGTSRQQLADLRTVADAESDRRIVEGICVTSCTWGRDGSGKEHDIPTSGFNIAEQLACYGGFDAALSTCKKCEANVDSGLNTKIAGCYGWLDVWPDSSEVDERLWKVIEERALQDRLRSAFAVTTPLWYGFWIESPLKRAQATLLLELIEPLCDLDDPKNKDVVYFLNALKAAVSWELPVHVSMAPPGHFDCGYYTVFPHCPRCKASVRFVRGQVRRLDDPMKCRSCGHVFVPRENQGTHSERLYRFAPSLEEQLGKAGYEEFARRFLVRRGCTEQQAEEVIDHKNNGPLLRRIAEVRRQRNATIRRIKAKWAGKSGELPPNIMVALTDDVVLDLVLVPAGEFMMGSNSSTELNERPEHVVRFERPFYIGRFPVTQSQWAAVMGKNPSKYKGDPDLPVDQVSWFDCQEFCDVVSKRQRRIIRLPSEAEWEYACRAGTSTAFAFGDKLSPEQANFRSFGVHRTLGGSVTGGTDADGVGKPSPRHSESPTPVGSYPPNAWGLYDMHGNVEEWCDDVWHENYDGAPANGAAWLNGEEKTPFRVARGGWYSAVADQCSSAARRSLRADVGSTDEDGEDDESEDGDDLFARMLDMMFTPHGLRVVCEAECEAPSVSKPAT